MPGRGREEAPSLNKSEEDEDTEDKFLNMKTLENIEEKMVKKKTMETIKDR